MANSKAFLLLGLVLAVLLISSEVSAQLENVKANAVEAANGKQHETDMDMGKDKDGHGHGHGGHPGSGAAGEELEVETETNQN
ncbi:hypothetical protein CJ030_MR4G026745 [Morella rubra]|uniref:Phase-change related protein n=1 Tax=Morella rubra TaxID=262757 RepID=A0A6A1VRA0_9ROSI|nr:hypothetical protein CJ030_MR4G026745 [Morella rubra]